MKQLFYILMCSMLSLLSGVAQNAFELPDGVDKLSIPIEIIGNVPIVSAEVNGTAMSFMIDTGASRSAILNVIGIDSLQVNNGNKVELQGYGNGKPVNAIESRNNVLNVGGFINNDADLFVVTDDQVSMLPILGREINGLIGIDFFKHHPIGIDYGEREIIIYKSTEEIPRSYQSRATPIKLKGGKPFITGKLATHNGFKKIKLLMDTGSGDSLWVYGDADSLAISKKGFQDYLGYGLKGDIYGTRTKARLLKFPGKDLGKITVAFPDIEMLPGNRNYDGSQGSVGGEVLHRFKIIYDFKNELIYIKPGIKINNGFYYNMSGLKLQEGKQELFSQVFKENELASLKESRSVVNVNTSSATTLNYFYVPKILISHVVDGSIAQRAGLQVGDEIISVNGRKKGNLNLNYVNDLFYNRPYYTIKMSIKRGEEKKTRKFRLKQVPLVD